MAGVNFDVVGYESAATMQQRAHVRGTFTRYATRGVGLAVAGYAAYAAAAWLRYGRPRPPGPGEEDPLLDRFLPEYDVAERHHIRVRAPAEVVLSAASQLDLRGSPLVRAIFDTRAWLLGAEPDARPAQGLLADMQSLGWRVLAEVPGREIVVGAITRPWKSKVVFQCPPPDAFCTDQRPGHVKIVWTLRADPLGPSESIFRSETRVTATDASARRTFRRYWAAFSAGIIVIRRVMLAEVRRAAERDVASAATFSPVQGNCPPPGLQAPRDPA